MKSTRSKDAQPFVLAGRYAVFEVVGAGGMAVVHIGRSLASASKNEAARGVRVVAVKRLHPNIARDALSARMVLDEARLAARVRHPNVAATLDVVGMDDELFVIMEFVEGISLASLLRMQRARVPFGVASRIMSGALRGLHAAHTATNEAHEPLGIVHRDVSPENILVGTDGMARLVDFGVAKARGRMVTTMDGELKGKLAYMSPEQLRGDPIDGRSDVFAASVVLWEMLTSRPLFEAKTEAQLIDAIRHLPIPTPSELVPEIPRALDDVVMRGLARDPDARYDSAFDMAMSLEGAVVPSPRRLTGDWLRRTAGATVTARVQRVRELERAPEEEIARAASPSAA